MEVYEERPPEYVSHPPNTIELPAVPKHDFAHAHVQSDIKLPGLQSLLSSAEFQQTAHDEISFASPTATSTSLPPIDVGNGENGTNCRNTDLAALSALEPSITTRTEDSGIRSTSAVSMDDPDVRIAAEALSGLGNPDFARSPSKNMFSHTGPDQQPTMQEREPLLDLLAQAHPWVGGTINGSMNAYETTKYYSPGFVRAGVGLVERNIAMPMVTTVGSVGRITGAENVARWYLNARRPGDVEDGVEEDSSRGKRRRLDADEMDVEVGLNSPQAIIRQDSQDSRIEPLPAYRASKPPSYREETSPVAPERSRRIPRHRPAHDRSWSSQIILSGSGLGVACSEASRNSLIYCLGLLGRSAEHIATVSEALKIVLEQYDQARDHWHQQHDSSMEKGTDERPRTPDHDESARRLAAVIKKYSDDIWETLKRVVTLVSNTTGSALPNNARNFVRNQLMSLPGRWRLVSANQTGDSETSRNAHRMIAFAKQGLDMITEVSQVCQDTLEKADDWLRMVGRRAAMETPHHRYQQQQHVYAPEQDEEMTDRHEELERKQLHHDQS